MTDSSMTCRRVCRYRLRHGSKPGGLRAVEGRVRQDGVAVRRHMRSVVAARRSVLSRRSRRAAKRLPPALDPVSRLRASPSGVDALVGRGRVHRDHDATPCAGAAIGVAPQFCDRSQPNCNEAMRARPGHGSPHLSVGGRQARCRRELMRCRQRQCPNRRRRHSSWAWGSAGLWTASCCSRCCRGITCSPAPATSRWTRWRGSRRARSRTGSSTWRHGASSRPRCT